MLLAALLASISGCEGTPGPSFGEDARVDVPLRPFVDASDAADARADATAGADRALVDAPSAAGCSLPTQRALTLPEDREQGLLFARGAIDSASCAPRAPTGTDAIHPVEVGAQTGVEFRLTEAPASAVLSVRRACADPGSELGCAHEPFATGDTALRLTLSPGRYYAVVDSLVDGALPYTLRVRSFTPSPHARCSSAPALVEGIPLTAQDTDGGVESALACADEGAPRLYYALSVPSHHRAVVTATPTTASASPVSLGVIDACAGGRCLASIRGTSNRAPSELRFDHRGESARTVYVVASGPRRDAHAVFDIQVRLEPLPRNAACERASPLVHGDRRAREDAALAAASPGAPVCDGRSASALFYSVTVPPGHTLRATVAPSDGATWQPETWIIDGCTETCLARTRYEPTTTASTVEHQNVGNAPRAVVIAVGGASSGPLGRFDLAVETLPAAPNARCEAPTRLTHGARITAQDAALGARVLRDCLGGASVRELYYAATIPAGQTLRVTARPTGDRPWSPLIHLPAGCGASACARGGAASAPNTPAVYSHTNRSEAPIELLVAVASALGYGSFDLESELLAAPENARCNGARALTSGETVRGEDISVGLDSLASRCLPTVSGPTRYYTVTLPPNHTLTATARPTRFDLALRLLADCGATTCEASVNAVQGEGAETLRYTNGSSAPRTLTLAVSAAQPSIVGTFDLDVLVAMAAPNPSCDRATTLPLGGHLAGEDASRAVAPPPACVAFGAGRALYYALNVPAGSAFRVRATPTGSAWDLALRVLSSCLATTCLHELNRAGAGAAEILEAVAPAAAAGPMVVVVSGASPTGAHGTFDLEAEPISIPSHTQCSAARAVSVGAAVTDDAFSRALPWTSPPCASEIRAPTLFYAVRAEANTRLRVRAQSENDTYPFVRVLTGCDATQCLASAYPARLRVSSVVQIANAGPARTYVVAVSAAGGLPRPISLTLESTPLASNHACAVPTPLRSGVDLAGEDVRGAVFEAPSCARNEGNGPVLFYRASVEPGYTAVVRAAPTGTTPWRAIVRAHSVCGTAPCVGIASMQGALREAALVHRNRAGAATDLIVSVGAENQDAEGTHTLSVDLVPPATNAVCANASAITASGTLRSQLRQGTETLTAACLPSHGGTVVYYRVLVPSGAALSVRAVAVALAWTPVVRILDRCGASVCLASQGPLAPPAVWRNPELTAREVIIAVGSQNAFDLGEAFDLTVEIQR